MSIAREPDPFGEAVDRAYATGYADGIAERDARIEALAERWERFAGRAGPLDAGAAWLYQRSAKDLRAAMEAKGTT